MSRFLDALRSGRVLLMDGAMGTELQRAGLRPGECGELWNLTHPEKVRAIHRAYVDAGAEVLLTNTFQANPEALAKHNCRGRLEDIIQSAVDLARLHSGSQHFVIACIGPLSLQAEGSCWRRSWIRQIVPATAGADAILLETFTAVSTARRVRSFIRQTAPIFRDIPVFISPTYVRNGEGELATPWRSRLGTLWQPPEFHALLVGMAHRRSFTALGVNCGHEIRMDEIIEIVRRYRIKAPALPLFARPNAGTPKRTGDQWVYPHTPEAMAARLPELLEAGVSMVGGCCGTTPAHIAAFRPIIDEWNHVQ